MLKDFGVADLHNSDGIIVEHSWHVFRWEFTRGVRDEQAGLVNNTISIERVSY